MPLEARIASSEPAYAVDEGACGRAGEPSAAPSADSQNDEAPMLEVAIVSVGGESPRDGWK